MQCVHQSLNGTFVASCSSLSFWVGLFLGPVLTRQSGGANFSSPSILSPAQPDIPPPPSPTPFNHSILFRQLLSILCFLLFHLYTMQPALQDCRKRFELKNEPVWSRQIHMSIVYTPLCTSSLIIVPSRRFRMCGPFSSSPTMLPARTTFLH